ncbi:MAG: hypothetical protein R3F55_00660 [Alphaproteobacteria bacterium]
MKQEVRSPLPRRATVARCVLAAAFVAASAAPLAAATPSEDCDRLAAAPDPAAGVAGIALEAIDAEAAIAACAQALRDHPDSSRLAFQYGRALQRDGQADAAAQLYAWAATDGLADAQYALGVMLQTGDGVAADPVAAARWLTAAADQGFAPAAEALASPPPPVATAAADAADPGLVALADDLDGLAGALDAFVRDAPRSRFDPLATVQAAGLSVDALTDWTRQNIVLVPYRGSLRGARGTLMDRHGNSLDRALLLATMLADAGYEVRLARAALSADAAAALRDAPATAVADAADPAGRAILATQMTDASADFAQALAADVAAAQERARADAATIDSRSARLADAVLAALGDVSAGADAGADAEAVAALQDHWWVQVRDGDGWVDADPSAPTVVAPPPHETMAPEALPDELRHAVALRLVVEIWQDGQLHEETILDHRLVPGLLDGQAITLRQAPLGTPPAQRLLEQPDPVAAVLQAAADAWVWQPELRIGDELVTDRLFTMRGEVLPADRATMQALGIEPTMFGDFEQRVGGLFDDDAPEPQAAPDEANAPVRITAEWLEIAVERPGAAAAVQRRTVFDLLGPDARASGAAPDLSAAQRMRRALGLMREVDVMVLGAAPAPSALRHDLARDSAGLLRAVAPLLRESDPTAAGAATDLPRIQLPMLRFALNRFAPSGATPDLYLDRPNVVLTWQGIAGTGAADLTASLLFDIVANDVAVSGADAFASRVAQGVRDTVVEDTLAGDGAIGNAAALHEADLAAGRGWQRLISPDPAALAAFDLPPEATAAIARDLADGAVVLLPPGATAGPAGPLAAWWRVDPATGTTLGMNPAGGAVMTEEAFLVWFQGIQVGGCFALMALTIAAGMPGAYAGAAICVAGGITGAVAGGIGGFVLSGASSLIGGVVAVIAG